MQKFNEELTGEVLNDLIINLGATTSVSYMHKKFNKPFIATIKAYLRVKRCLDPEDHVDGVISSSWLELQKDFVKYSAGEKKSDYISPWGFLVAVGLNLSRKHLREDIKKDRLIISPGENEEFVNDEIDDLIYKNSSFDVGRAIQNDSPEAQLRLKELVEFIDGFISQFSQIQQAAFNLYFFEDYPHKEIGKLLCITESSSRAHVSRVVRKIRPEIEKNFGGLR